MKDSYGNAQPSEEEQAELKRILDKHYDDDCDEHAFTSKESMQDALLKAFRLGTNHHGPNERHPDTARMAYLFDRLFEDTGPHETRMERMRRAIDNAIYGNRATNEKEVKP